MRTPAHLTQPEEANVKSWRDRREKAKRAAQDAAPKDELRLTVAERFNRYWEHIHPDPLDRPSDESVQFIETRRAFYAGVFEMLCTMGMINQPGVSEEALVECVVACRAECIAYFQKMKELYGIE